MRLRSRQVVDTVHDVDFSALRDRGIRILLLDLDKTLAPRKAAALPPSVEELLASLIERGFAIGILSNRRRPGGDPLIEALARRLPCRHTAGKPRPAGYLVLLDRLGGRPKDAAMIGDKWVTDILGANRLGIHSIRVRRFPTA